ncbi:unnamed protein product, partial [Ectocarpus sp. 4 AP-2014]
LTPTLLSPELRSAGPSQSSSCGSSIVVPVVPPATPPWLLPSPAAAGSGGNMTAVAPYSAPPASGSQAKRTQLFAGVLSPTNRDPGGVWKPSCPAQAAGAATAAAPRAAGISVAAGQLVPNVCPWRCSSLIC